MGDSNIEVLYNIPQWIKENKKFFLPPVCNKMLHQDGQMKAFFVGGPNQRKDFHIENGDELFYQIKGDMCLKVVEHGKHRDIIIKEGQIFLLPGRIAHSPNRVADTVGIVLERERDMKELDGLRYYVDRDDKPTTESLYEEWFHVDDLGTQLAPVIKRFFASEQCKTGVPIEGTIPKDPPIVLDSERTLEDPMNFQEWIDSHREEINADGKKAIFDGSKFQMQVFMFGQGENGDCVDCAETWIWQWEGESVISVDGKDYKMGKDDSLLVQQGQRFIIKQDDKALCLVCYQDPRLSPYWPGPK